MDKEMESFFPSLHSLSYTYTFNEVLFSRKEPGKLVIYSHVYEPRRYFAKRSQAEEEKKFSWFHLYMESKNIEVVETERDGIFFRGDSQGHTSVGEYILQF